MAGMLLTNRARQSLGGLGVSSNRGTLLTTARARNQKKNNSLLSANSTASAGAAGGQNNGGVIGGIGYLGHKFGLGVLSTLEGIWDYSAGGIAKLFGADEWAEEQFQDDWVDYNAADEWYDPSDGWRVAGDVAGGLGTSAVSIGAAFIPGVGPAASIAAAGLGAAGNATKEAYRTTGKLGGAEFGYGALVGATEAALEAVTGKIGAGSQRIASDIAERMGRSSAKEITKTVGKKTAKSVLGQIGKDFAGEAFEEGMAEILSPFYKNVTYSEGEKIDWKSVGYNALVGGISGVVMGGSQKAISTSKNYFSGKNAVKNGTTESILREAKSIWETERGGDASLGVDSKESGAEKGTGIAAFEAVKDTYDKLQASLQETGGELKTANQMMMLGALKEQNVAARLSIFVEKSAKRLVENADSFAARSTEFGMKDADGNPVSISAAQITDGVDLSDLNSKAGYKRYIKSLRRAMVNNSTLGQLAVADATGHLLLDTQKFAAAEQRALQMADATDLNQFLERASDKEKAALAERLGIEDFNMLSHESFRAAVAEMFEDGDTMRDVAKQNQRVKQAVSAENAAVLPETVTSDLADGVYRAEAQGNGLSVLKEGENFFVVNPATRDISRALGLEELTSTLRGVRAAAAAEGRLAIGKTVDNKPFVEIGNAKKSNSFDEKSSANDANFASEGREQQTSADLEGTTPPPQAVPRPSQGADGKSEQGAVQGSEPAAEDGGKARREAIAIDVWARENIPDYAGLNAPAKAAVRATVRNARANGIAESDVKTYARVAARSGLNISFDTAQAAGGDARFDGRNTVYVSPAAPAERIQSKLLLHEGGHALFFKTKSGKKLLARAVEMADAETAAEVRKQYTEYYEKRNVDKSAYEPIILEEIAAAGLEKALGVEGAWEFILSKRPTAGEKLLSFFRGAARDYAGVGELSAEARKLLRTYQKAFAELSSYNKGNNAVTGVNSEKMQDSGEGKLAIAGEHAKNANIGALATARQMAFEGADSEAIRQETGWFQGYDGKWRFEIDDSDVEFAFNGKLSRDPDVRRYAELVQKVYFDGTATDVEQGELTALDKKLDTKSIAPDKLGDMMQHPMLFEAYPQLADLSVRFTEGTNSASYHAGAKEITVPKRLKMDPKKFKSAILHEVQHAVQDIERFASGSNVNMFADTDEQSAYDQYYNTAGEIEARDVAARGDLTAEQRKNTRPDIDRSDVVFAENVAESFSIVEPFVDDYGNMYDSAVLLDTAFFDNFSPRNWGRELKKYVEDRSDNTPTIMPVFDENGNKVLLQFAKKSDRVSKNGGSKHQALTELYATSDNISKLAVIHIDEIIEVSEENNPYYTNNNEHGYFDKNGWLHRNANVINAKNGNIYNLTVDIAKTEDGRVVLYATKGKIKKVGQAKVNSLKARGSTPHSNFDISIPQNAEKSTPDAKNLLENRVSGDDLLNAQDLISDVRDLGAEVDERGYITLYHRTSASSAAAIRSTGMMVAKEDGLFFSTKENGQNVGYGDTVVTFKIPAEKLVLDDVFDDEAHLRYPLDKPGRVSMKEYLADTGKRSHGTTIERMALPEKGAKGTEESAKTAQKDTKATRKSGDVVTISRGEMAKLHANYAGDKVFDKKSVKDALSGIEAFGKLPAEIRNEFVNSIWKGYNQRLHQEGFEKFTDVMWHQLHATIMQEVGYDELGDMTEERYAEAERMMDEQIVAALDQIVASGKPSIKHKLENATSTEGYRKQANYWREEHGRVVERNKLLGRVKFEVEKLANAKMGRYVNAANYRGDTFRVAVNALAKMNWRGGLVRDAKIREHFATLDAWYCKDNPLYKGDGNGNELFRQEIKDALNALGNAQNGQLTNDDLLAAETVIKYFAHEIEAHDTVYKNGKRVDAMPLAKEYVAKIGRAAEISGRGLFTRSSFSRLTADPALLMRQADGYLDGFFTEQFEELRRGTIDAAVKEREIAAEFEKFWEEHSSYGKRYNNASVTFDGREMPLQEAISLYMTMKREHAFAGLAAAGFEIEGKRATKSVSEGFLDRVEEIKANEYRELPPEELLTLTKAGHERIEQAALKKAVEEKREALAKQFTAEDKALIAVMERGLEVAREVKIGIDRIIQGYSNVTGGYYFPIKRTGLAENVDAFTGFEGDRVSNLSINKDTVKNAHKLFIEPVHVVYMRHIKAVSLYHGLGVFTDNFNRLFNLNTVSDINHPVTVRDALGSSNAYTKDMLTYFKELKQDVEGISKKRATERFYNDAVSYIRSAYATYQLGANPKVWVTQLSSFVAATNMLDADCLARGLAVSGKDVDEYCRLAWLRNNDNAAAMAQAVSTPQNAVQRAGRGVLQKIRNASTWMIGKMDRLVVRKLFAACQVQVEKNGGAKVGTKENKVAAGEMLTRVILETQQNSLMTERSAAMRSGDELLKGSTMFSADAMKITARAVETDGKLRALKHYYKEAKKAGREAEAASLQKQIKAVRKQKARAMSAFVGVALFNAALAYAFKWLYRRDEEEDVGTFLADTFGNMLGGIPFVRDAWSLFYDGYELDNFAFATYNDVVKTVSASYTLLQKAADGEEITRQQTLAHMRKILYAMGQLTGVPVRNIYNVSTGMINRISPETGYEVDSLFYQKNYRTDLQKALESEDEERAAFLLGLVLEGETQGEIPAKVREEMLSLLGQNYGVLPRATPKKYTKDGEEIELDAEQQAQVAASYAEIPAALNKLFGSAGYQQLSTQQRAEAIGYLYDLYRAEALTSATGEEFRTARERVAGIVGLNTYVTYCVATKGIASDVDKNGETVAGSKRKKVVKAISALGVPVEQRLLLICASGYAIKDGDVRGLTATAAKKRLLRYVLSLKVSAAEKASIAEMCGFEVKNGRIRASSVG